MFLLSCGPESSPDGRSRLRDQKLQVQVDSMASQQQAILDTLARIRLEMKQLKESNEVTER